MNDEYRFGIAFYNLENLFDTKDDPHTLDDDFTPESRRRWTDKRLHKKLDKLSRVIAQVGVEEVGHPPVIVGLAEVENREVVDMLLERKPLKDLDYRVVHFDSPDERGIDTALIYRAAYFEVVGAKANPALLYDEDGNRDYTRDILQVHGKLVGQDIHLFVNHWPSRRKGVDETEPKRMKVAEIHRELLEAIWTNDTQARVIVMGDFNDDPKSKSIEQLKGTEFINPLAYEASNESGSLNHDQEWYLFDQILVSHNMLDPSGSILFLKSDIYDPDYLREYHGPYKGAPFRSYAGRKFLGGYSDHFPVFSVFRVVV